MIVIPVEDISFDRREIVGLRYTNAECAAIHRESLLIVLLGYGSMALTSVWPWLLPVALAVAFFGTIRYLGLIHGLIHANSKGAKISWLLELLPNPMLPFTPSFKAAQRYHLLHHKLSLADSDPENVIVSGRSKLLIFVKCALIVEWWWLYGYQQGWDRRRFWLAWALRALMLASLVYLTSWLSVVWFLITTRVATGVAIYMATYAVHVQGDRQGQFLIFPHWAWVNRISSLFNGAYSDYAVRYHALHHAKPWVSVARLDRALAVSNYSSSAPYYTRIHL